MRKSTPSMAGPIFPGIVIFGPEPASKGDVSVSPYPIAYGNLASFINFSTLGSTLAPPIPKNVRCPPKVFFSCFPAIL